MVRVLFVCHGNICRSPMAEFILKDMLKKEIPDIQFIVESAATSTEEIGSDIHYGTKSVLDKYKINYDKRTARQITKEDYNNYDYLIGMDSANVRNMIKIFGSDKDKKISKLLDYTQISRDVADPWYTHDFEATYRDIVDGCEKFIEQIKKRI